MQITGIPNSFSNFLSSTMIPFFFASSIRFTQSMTRSVNSNMCNTNVKFLSNEVASNTINITSVFAEQINSFAQHSSALSEKRE